MIGESRKASRAGRLLVGDNVKRRRRALDYTQRELAEVTGGNPYYISHIESGLKNLTLSRMERLAEGLMCSLAALVGGHQDPVLVHPEGRTKSIAL
jgi:transcriptional regulator with XRE-family HTH domain